MKNLEIGKADELLAEGRSKAKREQIHFMEALQIVVAKRLNKATEEMSGNKQKNGNGHVG